MLAYTRFEVVRTLRNVRFLVFAIGMPAVFYLMFNNIYRGAQVESTVYSAYILVSMAAYSAIGAALYNGASVPVERASGWLRQLRITPLSSSSWLLAKVLVSVLVVLPGLVVISLCAVIQGGVRLDAAQWAALAAVVLAGSIPFGCLGLLVCQLFDSQSAQPAQGAVLLVMSFGGGLFFPMSTFPPAVRSIGQALPSYHLFELGREVVSGQVASTDHLLWLAAWIAVLGAAVVLTWRREGVAAAA